MKTVYFHIGAPKTGTTSIQHFCHENRQALAARGLWYPQVASKVATARGRKTQAHAHHALSYALRLNSRRQLEKANAQLTPQQFDDLLAEFAASAYPKMLFSAENLFQHARLFSPELVPSRLAEFKVIVICYVRRADEFIEALYKTAVLGKGRYTVPASEFVESRIPKYAAWISAFAELVAADNVIVRSFEDTRRRLLEDFFSAVLETADSELLKLSSDYTVNTSLGAEHTLFMRELTRAGAVPPDFARVRRAFRDGALPGSRNCSLLSAEDRRQLIAEYNCEVEALNRLYGAGLSEVREDQPMVPFITNLDRSTIQRIMGSLESRLPRPAWRRLSDALQLVQQGG